MDYKLTIGPDPCPEPGFYPNATEQEYRRWNAFNYSSLAKAHTETFAHARFALDGERKETDAMKQGRLFHAAILEPEKVDAEYRVLPLEIKRRAGSAWEQLSAANPGVSFYPQGEWDKMFGVIDGQKEAIMSHEIARSLVLAGQHEVPFVGDLTFMGPTGDITVRAKGKADIWIPQKNIIADIKSTATTDPRRFGRVAYDKGYHIQVALYTDLIASIVGESPRFMYVGVENWGHYNVQIFNAHNAADDQGGFLNLGRVTYQILMCEWLECEETGHWPGYEKDVLDDNGVLDMIIPSWAS